MVTVSPLSEKYFGLQFCHGWFRFRTPSATQVRWVTWSVGGRSRLMATRCKGELIDFGTGNGSSPVNLEVPFGWRARLRTRR